MDFPFRNCSRRLPILLSLLLFATVSAQSPSDPGSTGIYLEQNMTSQVVQEREQLTINLGEYFKGSLLHYSLCIANRSDAEQACQTNDTLTGQVQGPSVDTDIS